MIAKKDNKEYSVTDATKAVYLKDGYDIYNDNGEVIEYSPKKTISYNEYIKEIENLKEKMDGNPEELQELKDQVEALNTENKSLSEEKLASVTEIAKLQSEKEELEKENKELKDQVEALKKGETNGKVQK